MHNSFILQQYVCYTMILNIFWAAHCSSSGGQIVSPQPLVFSPSVNSRTVCRLREDSSPCFCYPPLLPRWLLVSFTHTTEYNYEFHQTIKCYISKDHMQSMAIIYPTSKPSWFCSISSPFFLSTFFLATPVTITTPELLEFTAVPGLPSLFLLSILFTFLTSSWTPYTHTHTTTHI